VWLIAQPVDLARRLESDGGASPVRPALTPLGTIAESEQVLAVRTPLYASLADVVIDTSGQSPDLVAAAVLACWKPSRSP
jgi:shikimate kinase